MENELKKKLLNFPTDLIDRIEDYQFETRKPNFTATVMELLEKALTEHETDKPAE